MAAAPLPEVALGLPRSSGGGVSDTAGLWHEDYVIVYVTMVLLQESGIGNNCMMGERGP